eukprot:CAMPEP_0172831682 /NCGR_PEP_ID=MMETSP1075-20121228/23139_1 /TAXON_ID=2916 /ORGANISM="Ceratium fusus, Strain PA161109" /LENGTH=174 /DNA_ID=CAMNT_0013674183 /DNA_START=5 /DNA_END=526 /DNA_ORIENTATION=+
MARLESAHKRRRDCSKWDEELGCLCASLPAASLPTRPPDLVPSHIASPRRHSRRRECNKWDDELGCKCFLGSVICPEVVVVAARSEPTEDVIKVLPHVPQEQLAVQAAVHGADAALAAHASLEGVARTEIEDIPHHRLDAPLVRHLQGKRKPANNSTRVVGGAAEANDHCEGLD